MGVLADVICNKGYIKIKSATKYMLFGGLTGYVVLHPLVMISADLMSASAPGHAIFNMLVAELEMAFSHEMLPWSMAFTCFGALVGFFFGKIRDVESSLRESEERFRGMATAAQDAMISAPPVTN